MAIPIAPIVFAVEQGLDTLVTTLAVEHNALELRRAEIEQFQQRRRNLPLTHHHHTPSGVDLNGSMVFGDPHVHTLPRKDRGVYARSSEGEILMFAIRSEGIVAMPLGTFKRRKALERAGVNLLVFNRQTGQYVDYIPKRRRMNPLNFRALKRASRRVDAFEKVIKKHFSVGAAKKKRIKRKKRR